MLLAGFGDSRGMTDDSNQTFELSPTTRSPSRGDKRPPARKRGDDDDRPDQQFLVLRGDGSITYVSEQLAQLIGFDRGGDAEPPVIDDALLIGQHSFWNLVLERFSAHRFIENVDATLVTQAGSQSVVVDASLAQVGDGDGRAFAIIVHFRELGTEPQAVAPAFAAEALSADEELLRLANIGRSSRMLVHEIMNPMTVIVGNLDITETLLGRPGAVSRDQIRHIHLRMRRATVQITDIVRGITGVATARGKASALRSSAVDAIEVVLDWYAADFAAQGIEIVRRLPPKAQASALEVSCPQHVVIQVLTNLLMNARDALVMGAPGAVRRIQLHVRRVGSFVELTVSDSAPIPDQDAPKRVGFGIGLRICRQLLEGVGGFFHCEDDPKPTRYVMVLPAAEPRSPV